MNSTMNASYAAHEHASRPCPKSRALASWIPILLGALLAKWPELHLQFLAAPLWGVGIAMQLSAIYLRRRQQQEQKLIDAAEQIV